MKFFDIKYLFLTIIVCTIQVGDKNEKIDRSRKIRNSRYLSKP